MWRRIGCIALVVLALAVIAGIIYQQTKGEGKVSFTVGKKKANKGDEDKDPFFEAARIGDLKLVVEATGSTEPITDIEVKSEANGRIVEFFVEEGDHVSAGDLICKLDQSNQKLVVQAREIDLERAKIAYQEAKSATSPTSKSSLENQLISAESALNSAKEAFENAKKSYERIVELHNKGFATDQELENAKQGVVSAEASYDSAQANYEHVKLSLESFESTSNDNSIEQSRLTYKAAQVSLNEAKKQLGDSVIVSPIDGIILEKPLDIGDSVTSINSSYGGGNTIVKVADLSKIQVRTSVDEVDIGKIKIDQSATIEVDTYFDREFTGTVTNIYPQGVMTGSGLVNFIVMIQVDNTENLLLGNMTASVTIEADKQVDKLLIPLAATRRGDKDSTIVYVLNEGEDEFDKNSKTEEREVTLGDTDFYDVVVIEGLDEGEKVKVRGFDNTFTFE